MKRVLAQSQYREPTFARTKQGKREEALVQLEADDLAGARTGSARGRGLAGEKEDE